MDVMKKVCDTLNANKALSYERKVEILDLVYDFHKEYSTISLDNLCQKLRFLKVENGSKFCYPDAIQYSPLENKIIINREKEATMQTDRRQTMMKALLAVITSKSINYGFNGNSRLDALNEGFSDILANNLTAENRVQSSYDGERFRSDYEDEQILVNFIGKAVGFETFKQAFFENKPEILMETLLRKCSSPENLNSWLERTNNNMKTRRNTGESKLFSIQGEAMKMFEYDKSYIMSRELMEAGTPIKYSDYDKIEALLKEQARQWSRGR